MSDTYRWWSDALQAFIESDDHTVELVAADGYGAQVEIDGTPMFRDGTGYPWETFNLGEIDGIWSHLSEDGKEKLRSMEGQRR